MLLSSSGAARNSATHFTMDTTVLIMAIMAKFRNPELERFTLSVFMLFGVVILQNNIAFLLF